jgi:hypothetical protein
VLLAFQALLYSLEHKIALVAFSQDDCYTMFDDPLVDFFHVVYHEPKVRHVSFFFLPLYYNIYAG